MPVVIGHQDTTHTTSLVASDAQCALSAVPAKGTAFHTIARRFCHANQRNTSFLPQIAGLSALHSV